MTFTLVIVLFVYSGSGVSLTSQQVQGLRSEQVCKDQGEQMKKDLQGRYDPPPKSNDYPREVYVKFSCSRTNKY